MPNVKHQKRKFQIPEPLKNCTIKDLEYMIDFLSEHIVAALSKNNTDYAADLSILLRMTLAVYKIRKKQRNKTAQSPLIGSSDNNSLQNLLKKMMMDVNIFRAAGIGRMRAL